MRTRTRPTGSRLGGLCLGLLLAVSLAVMLAMMLLPLLATLAYGFSERWDRSLWPEGLSLRWLQALLQEPRVAEALWRTLGLSLLCASLALACGTAATLAAALASPALGRLLALMDLLPYAIPAVVVAVGALDVFIGRWGGWMPLWLAYVLCATPLLLPVVHKTVTAGWLQIEARPLLEASRTLGASDVRLLRRVLLPLLAPQLLAAWLLAWVMAAMEFAIANLLLGSRMELLQPLMNSLRSASGHQAAALISLTFLSVAAIAALVQGLMSWSTRRF